MTDKTKQNNLSESNGEERVFQQVRDILTAARDRAWRAVNDAMVTAYWEVGRAIVEEEQRGEARADYGKHLIENLARRLTVEFGEGFRASNLRNIRQFYLAFPIRYAVRSELTWTHYRLLMRIDNEQARSFYEQETVNSRWSTRELERQINSMLFERLALSRDKEGVLELAREGQTLYQPTDLVKDPYVLEFTGIPEATRYLEADLETALIEKLQEFLLELGKGFAFMGRQHRLTIGHRHFYVDLVFYNRLTRCFVLIDLKAGELTHQDIGQMQMYVHYYQREMMIDGENPPIGIILCADKDEAIVRYTLPEGDQQIFASRYQLHLPTEEELAREIQREREIIEREQALGRARHEMTGDKP
jgi:predicted nuclease of restriction endonuclease-like (RecB) superfamily